MKGTNPPCPCGSGQRYSACCRRFHRGEEPGDPVTLMRSRYAAYALGEVEYLWKTLDPEHPDRQRPEAAALAELRQSRAGVKYAGLRILDHDEHGDDGRVLFHASLFQGGKDRSFAELSRFRRHDGAWRYLDGSLLPLRDGDPRISTLTLATFTAAAAD